MPTMRRYSGPQRKIIRPRRPEEPDLLADEPHRDLPRAEQHERERGAGLAGQVDAVGRAVALGLPHALVDDGGGDQLSHGVHRAAGYRTVLRPCGRARASVPRARGATASRRRRPTSAPGRPRRSTSRPRRRSLARSTRTVALDRDPEQPREDRVARLGLAVAAQRLGQSRPRPEHARAHGRHDVRGVSLGGADERLDARELEPLLVVEDRAEQRVVLAARPALAGRPRGRSGRRWRTAPSAPPRRSASWPGSRRPDAIACGRTHGRENVAR